MLVNKDNNVRTFQKTIHGCKDKYLFESKLKVIFEQFILAQATLERTVPAVWLCVEHYGPDLYHISNKRCGTL